MSTDPLPISNDPAAWALRYAALGLRVVPIRPGAKAPALNQWVTHATNDPDTITSWWSGLYRGHGVGLALGAFGVGFIFAVDIDQHGHDGEESWRELLARYDAAEPDTWEAITGGGGRHLLFFSQVEIRNSDTPGLAGIDIRGAGGQILVEPTMHPSGQPYGWVDGASPWDIDLAPAPAWLLEELMAKRTSAPVERAPAARDTDRPGDLWANATPWSDILSRDGWTLDHTDATGEEYWVRPGKEARDGHSATVGYGGGDTLKVFTSSVAGLDAEATYTKLGYLAAVHHTGDHSAAAQALVVDGWSAPAPSFAATFTAKPELVEAAKELGWEVASPELARAAFDGTYVTQRQTMLLRPDGAGLIYPGKVHSFAAEPGVGKTWIGLLAVVEAVERGEHAMVVDFEDTAATTFTRLRQMGADDRVVDQVHHVTPTTRYRDGALPTNVTELAARCSIVLIDSTGEALAHSGLDQNVDDDVTAWMRHAPRALARLGPAVVLIDHQVKDKESQGRWAIGSQRKLAAIDGVAYTVRLVEAFSQVKAGRMKITCAKDRGGNYGVGVAVLDVAITPLGGGDLRLTVEVPPEMANTESGWMPTHIMEEVSRWIEDLEGAGASKRQLTESLGRKAKDVRLAVDKLVELGHLEARGTHMNLRFHILTPYREPHEMMRETFVPNGVATRVPVASHPRPGRGSETGPESRPSRPPPEGGRDSDSTDRGSPRDTPTRGVASQPDDPFNENLF